MSEQLPTEQFEGMRSEMDGFSRARDEVMNRARGLLKEAKNAIYQVHQGSVDSAQQTVDSLREAHVALKEEFSGTLNVELIGPYAEALEEYVEAACFVAYAQGRAIPTRADLGVPAESYLGGLSDLTGELTRRAVFAAIDRDKEAVQKIHAFIAALQGEMLQFHLRNGSLRKKYDSMKYNLKKVEQTLYDMEMHQ